MENRLWMKYEEIKEVDKEKGTYKKLVLDNGKIVGAILLGDKRQIMSIKKLIAQEKDIRQYKHTILKKDFDFKTITSLCCIKLKKKIGGN